MPQSWIFSDTRDSDVVSALREVGILEEQQARFGAARMGMAMAWAWHQSGLDVVGLIMVFFYGGLKLLFGFLMCFFGFVLMVLLCCYDTNW